MTETNYSPPVSQLLTLGDCFEMVVQPDYLALGLGPEHVPDLIRLALDNDLRWDEAEGLAAWAPIHAWRVLGHLRAEAAAEPLTRLFANVDEFDDEWASEELPEVMGLIGPAAIPALTTYLADPAHGLWARITAASALEAIGRQHPEARDACITALSEQLEHFADQDPTLNAFIVGPLVHLKAVEAAPVMERAFAAQRVDPFILGDWEEVQVTLGLLDKRQTPRPGFMGDLFGLESQRAADETQRRAQKRQEKKRKARQKQSRKKGRKRK